MSPHLPDETVRHNTEHIRQDSQFSKQESILGLSEKIFYFLNFFYLQHAFYKINWQRDL
jgi:hypothetical protein